MKGSSLKNILLSMSLLASFASVSVQADVLEEIKKKGEIVIATEARYAPFEMLEDGKIVGYGKDILDEILKDLPGVKLKQLDLPFQGILAGLSSERYDFVATSLTVTKARAEKYAFTYPISTAALAILKRKGDDSIKTAEDMSGKVVGTQAGSAQNKVLEAFVASEIVAKGKPGLKALQEFTDYNEAYAALASRRVDLVPQAIPNLAPIVKKRPELFEIVQPPFGPATYYGWVGRPDAESASLVQFFSDGIEKLHKSGKLTELQQKWFGFTMDLPTGSVPAPMH